MAPVTVNTFSAVWVTSPALVVERMPLTVVSPKSVVPLPLVTVVNPFVIPLTSRFPPAARLLSPVEVSIALSSFLPFRLTALPADTVTVPPKSFTLFDSVIS